MRAAWKRLRIWGRKQRYVIRANPLLYRWYKVGVGVIGLLVLAGGIVAIPYPGPGWLIVFLGLGILASEFVWAQRLLRFVRAKYNAWLGWFKRQHWSVQGVFGLGTCAIVLASLWLLGALATVGGWVGYHPDWIAGPIR
ncbi:MAG: TIGR02611 family protein [Gordonia sp. (in: high G+C Gram-positive bacteria)]